MTAESLVLDLTADIQLAWELGSEFHKKYVSSVNIRFPSSLKANPYFYWVKMSKYI